MDMRAAFLSAAFFLLPGTGLEAQPYVYRTSVEADGRYAAGEEWFTGVTAKHSLRDIPFHGRYVLEAVRATVPRTEFVAGLRFGEDKLHRATGDAHRSYFGHAAVLVTDDVAVGPVLRYDYRDAGSREHETVFIAAMADVYGSKIRMRWVAGAMRYRYRWSQVLGGASSDPEWAALVENHMALGGSVTGYTHVISFQVSGEGLIFLYAPVLEFALKDWLTAGPLFEGSFGALTGGAALRAEAGIFLRGYFQSRLFIQLTPRYPVWSYDDYQINGVFVTGGVGFRL